MVKLRRPAVPERIVVKPARPPKRAPAPTRCIVCRGILGSDHAGDLVCQSHWHTGYNPRGVTPSDLDERIAVLLLRAAGRPVVLCRALGCEASETNLSAIRDSVKRLNATGIIRVVSCGVSGRKLAQLWRAQRRRV